MKSEPETSDEAAARRARRRLGWLRMARWAAAGLGFLCRALVVGWTALAIQYSNLPWGWARTLGALGFLAFGAWALFVSRDRRAFWGFAAVLAGVMVWWSLIRPSHEREWRPEVAVLPRAVVEGDRVTLTGVRHFEYRSKSEFTERYEERVVELSHLESVDFYVSYWKLGPVAHTFVSFNFDNAPPVCVSIEARLEKGEVYSPVASLFKRYELIYVVGDERDIVGVRTNHRGESVYRYRTMAKPEGARRFFLSYLRKINALAERPEFYHLLSNNCTVNIVRHAQKDGERSAFDVRMLLNGYLDGYLYLQGALDDSVPFGELRERALIYGRAGSEREADFSERIREETGAF